MTTEANKYGLSDAVWDRMGAADHDLMRLIRPLPRAVYAVDHPIRRLETSLESYAADSEKSGGTFDLNPDFQRGHVWTRAQQVAYVENVFRGIAPVTFKFNCRLMSGRDATVGDIHPGDFVCVDGLQRLTALRAFLRGDFGVFGDKRPADFDATTFDIKRLTWTCKFEIFDFNFRADLLQFYLDLNAGGTIHAPEELDRVRGLLAKAGPIEPVSSAKRPPRARP